MAKRAKTAGANGAQTINLHVGTGEHADDADDQEAFDALDKEEGGALSQAVEQLRAIGGTKADVFRVLPVDRAGFCRSYSASVFSAERIATDYGPGRYRVKFKGPDEKYLKGGTLPLDIAEGLTPFAPAALAGGGVQDLIAIFREERNLEKANDERKKAERLEWVKLLAPLLAPKLLEMFGGQKGPSLSEMARTLKDLKDLQGPPTDLNSQFQQVVGILQGAKDLVGDDGGGKTGSTWVDLLRDFLSSPAAGALASAIPGMMPQGPMLQPSPAPSTSAAALPSPNANAGPPGSVASSGSAPVTAPASQGPDVFQQLTWLRQTLGAMLVQAQRGSQPRLYAEVVLDNLPPFIAPKDLLARLSAADWWTQLQGIDGRVAPHAEWFQKFRDNAVKMLARRERKAAEAAAPPPAQTPEPRLPGKNEPMQGVEGGDFE